MTQQEILEYNKRCVKFLEWKNKGMINLELWISTKNQMGIETSDLEFHSDWNCIMEMVKVIEKLNFTVIIEPDTCIIQSDDGEYLESSNCFVNCSYEVCSTRKTKKQAVVSAINEFLIWYEQNKNQNQIL